jgi:WD40 repeat protein
LWNTESKRQVAARSIDSTHPIAALSIDENGTFIAFSSDGRNLQSDGQNRLLISGQLGVWDLATNRVISSPQEQASDPSEATFVPVALGSISPDGQFILAKAQNGGVGIWSTAEFSKILEFELNQSLALNTDFSYVSGCILSEQGDLAAIEGEQWIGVFDVATGKPVSGVSIEASGGLQFCDSDRRLLHSNYRGISSIPVRSLDRQIRYFGTEGYRFVASDDGRFCAVEPHGTGLANEIRLFDTRFESSVRVVANNLLMFNISLDREKSILRAQRWSDLKARLIVAGER